MIEDIVHKKSLVRFVDEEFSILFQRERKGMKFQYVNEERLKRMEVVLHSNHPQTLVGIADN